MVQRFSQIPDQFKILVKKNLYQMLANFFISLSNHYKSVSVGISPFFNKHFLFRSNELQDVPIKLSEINIQIEKGALYAECPFKSRISL